MVSAVAPKAKPTPTPSTSVLGTSLSRKPILPVTGPDFPGSLGLVGSLVTAGAVLLRRRAFGADCRNRRRPEGGPEEASTS